MDGNNNFGLGNSILLENNKYFFIGNAIYEFSTYSPVIHSFK